MKRIWFAVIFLVLCISFCVGEQLYVKKVYNDLNNQISQATEYDSFEDLVQAITNIQAYWNKHNDYLFAISYQSNLDNLSVAINTLDAQDENIVSKLHETKAYNKVFFENQRISIENIL